MLQGIDVSTWQGEMDWQKAFDAGAKFAFIRAGSCTSDTGFCYTDYQFVRNASFAPELMPVGYYWYFRPQHQPLNQADYFCNLILTEDWLMPPVIDLENSGGLSSQGVTDAASMFVERVKSLTGYWSLCYSRSFWLHANTVYATLWDNLDLWIALYNDREKPWGYSGEDPDYTPPYWNDWKFWQYSADGNDRGAEFGAESDDIDLNYFNGDLDDLHEYLNIKPVVPLIVEVNVARNSVLRNKPRGRNISIAPQGLRFAVVGSQEDDNGKLWYDVGGYWLPAGNVKVIE